MTVRLANNARDFLAANISSVSTSLEVEDASSFPVLLPGEWFNATLESTNGAYEIVRVTGITGTTFAITRGQEDTIAIPFVAGASVKINITVQNLTDFLLLASNVNDDAYDASWNGDVEDAPSRNALYDKLSAMDTLIAGKLVPADIGVTVQAYDADTAKTDLLNTFRSGQVIGDNTAATDLTVRDTLAIDTIAAGTNAKLSFRDAGVEKWAFDKTSGHNLSITNGTVGVVALGNATTGVIDWVVAPTISGSAIVTAAAYTAADVLAKLLTVDGAGSGLDADLLDGYSSAAFGRLAATNTWAAAQTLSYDNAAAVMHNIVSTSATNMGVVTQAYHNSASPAAFDLLHTHSVAGNDSGANATTYGQCQLILLDPTNGSEDGYWSWSTIIAGTLAARLLIGGGLYHGSATGGDKGNNTLNFGTLYQNNVQVATLAANNFPAAQTITTSSGNALILQGNDAGVYGPTIATLHNSASPASFDVIMTLNAVGLNSTPAQVSYGQVTMTAADITAASEDGRWNWSTRVAGTMAERMMIAGGVFHPSATSGDMGNNTINYGAVYDDGAILCAPLHEETTQEDWDAIMPDRVEQAVTERVELLPGVSSTAVITPERRTPRKHRTAKRHFDMVAEGFKPGCPTSFSERLRTDKAVPGMPSLAEWKARMEKAKPDKISAGERFERTMLAMDYMALTIATLADRVAQLEAAAAKSE